MNEFILIFRSEPGTTVPTPEQMKQISQPWQDWMGSLAAQNKLANMGNRLDYDGSVLKTGQVVTNGPYAEIKEVIVGYSVVKASDLKEAIELAKGCPILVTGGSVEVRQVIQMG
jgi:hypothetical protein